MRNIYRLFLLFMLVTCLKAEQINLTDEEIKYLESNTISVAFLSDYAPFSFYENKIIKGYTVDLFSLISNKLNIKFTKVVGKWSDNLHKFKDNKIDVITDISYIKEREGFTAFTTPYFEVPTVIFTRDDFGTYGNFDSLKGKKIGILKDIFYSDKLKNLKDREIVEYTKYEDLTKALSYGKIDAIIQSLATINYFTKKNNITNLKIVDEFNFDGIGKEDVRFGVNPENKILHSILQKGLNSVTEEEKALLVNKWIGSNFNKYENNIELTKEERDYLTTKGIIKVCVDPNWMPIERINENGIHEGIAADFLNLISKRANIKFELYKTVSWSESLDSARGGKCDILSFLNITDDRIKWLNFTQVLHEEPRVFITRGEHEFIIDVKQFKNKTIALPRDYSTVEIIRNIYPNLKIILVDSELEALRFVSKGKADMTLNTMNVSAYTIKKEGFFNLKVAGQMSKVPNTFSIGVIKGEGDVLVNILNKAIESISLAEKEEIINKYVSIDIKQGIDYAMFWRILIIVSVVVFFVFGILLYRNRLLNLYNNKLTKAKIDLENEVGQKELLLKELNHRVKNNLQIISGIVSLHASKKDISGVLEEIENNISTISVAYDLLAQKKYTGAIELKHYLETLLDSIIPIQLYNIQRYVVSKGLYLDIHDAVTIGLIMTECINNSVKYAFKAQETNPTIIVSIEEIDTNITINFSDNGMGFSDLHKNGLGLELITTLCNNRFKTKPVFYNNNGANIKISIAKSPINP